MTTDRIKEIQEKTAHPNSVSVQQALLQVWNECEQSSYSLYLEVPIAGTNATITNSYKCTEDDLRQAMIVVLVSNSSLNKQD